MKITTLLDEDYNASLSHHCKAALSSAKNAPPRAPAFVATHLIDYQRKINHKSEVTSIQTAKVRVRASFAEKGLI